MITFLWIAGCLLVLLGVAGTVLPALPGLPILFAGSLLIAWAGDFQQVGTISLVILGVLAVLGSAVDFVAGLLGAKVYGASRMALWGSLAGSIVGIFFGLPGLLLGPLLGAALGEWRARRCWLQAGKVGVATFVGLIIGTVAKVGTALAMLGVLVFALLL